MNQKTKAFLTQFRDLCQQHDVKFGSLYSVSFYSDDESPSDRIAVEVDDIEDLEEQLARVGKS